MQYTATPLPGVAVGAGDAVGTSGGRVAGVPAGDVAGAGAAGDGRAVGAGVATTAGGALVADAAAGGGLGEVACVAAGEHAVSARSVAIMKQHTDAPGARTVTAVDVLFIA